MKTYFETIQDFFPNSLKWLLKLWWVGFILPIVGYIVIQLITGKEIEISWEALKISGYIFLGWIVILTIGYFWSLHRIAKKFIAGKLNTVDTNKQNYIKKKLPHSFELENKIVGFIEYTVFVGRKWYPNQTMPGLEDFINAIELSDPKCSLCQSDIYRDNLNYYECKNPECENDESIHPDKLFEIKAKVRAIITSEIRKNYDKFWNKYIKVYDDFTGKKYDDYWDTII